MTYVQDLSACFGDALGAVGISESAFTEAVRATAPALDRLRAQAADGSLPLLALPGRSDDLETLAPIAERYRGLDDVVVLGTGGSSLGGQALCALGTDPDAPRLHFLDNIDPDRFDAVMACLEPARTGLIVISKSGGTAETLTQFFAALPRLSAGDDAHLGDRVLLITEPGDRPLRRLGMRYGLPILDHDPKVGGRFSALSLVGMLPAMIAGVDVAAIRAGAGAVLDGALATDDPSLVPPATGAALNVVYARERDVVQSVLMPYSDILEPFGRWYRQLWAESLGKEGHGTTPIPAVGAVDQHSQLQLYLGGPNDKLYTLVLADRRGTGARVDPSLAEDLMADGGPLAYLAGRTMGDLMEAEQRATAETLARNGRPVRILGLPRVDARGLGALMMHYMLETIIAAHLLGVDPFDQPAVEEGKVLARETMARMGPR